MLLELEDHELLEEFVAHEELLGGAANVTVVVHDTHAGETGDLHLHGDVLVHVRLGIGTAGGVRTGRASSLPVDEALVTDFINHLLYYLIINNFNGKK